jgi:hypothetical protein
MARKRYGEDDILRLIREVEVYLHHSHYDTNKAEL